MRRPAVLELPSTSIVVADFVGRGHVNAGLHCHAEIQKAYAAAGQAGTAVDLSYVLSLAMPAVSNLALGLEIFLKMHHFQNTGCFPTGHDIGILATSFAPAPQQVLRNVFLAMRDNEAVQAAATIKVGVGEKKSDFAAVWPEDAPDLDSAATQLGRAYERWRYIYEELHSPLEATIAFKSLLAMVFTLDFAIRSFRSEAFVSVGESAA
jgi:hypothetical protein